MAGWIPPTIGVHRDPRRGRRHREAGATDDHLGAARALGPDRLHRFLGHLCDFQRHDVPGRRRRRLGRGDRVRGLSALILFFYALTKGPSEPGDAGHVGVSGRHRDRLGALPRRRRSRSSAASVPHSSSPASCCSRADVFRLDGRVALVTGAASGIGAATARVFAEAGADVVAGWYPADPHDVEPTRAAVEGAGRRCLVVEVDVSDTSSVDAMVGRAVEELGRLDVVVANAAIARDVPSPELDDERWNARSRSTWTASSAASERRCRT